ncbi:uncharacterized protein EV420DRAFT_1760438 [Desarmillaria tabescens]|uniref:LysM domain-containing protein n=1 Tax=Armillaria tabescens TaxID=1929756 RepID=A0AA39NEY8_ARMTA|nr:uncharacterized protein EV420DRAFT_1760438 [Desarmillaria tabescens]KAK0464402.1 hypothetical protein EV420DRAFT_1760438 [Desarmillaria tabescens]
MFARALVFLAIALSVYAQCVANYTVVAGDTLTSIAARQGVTVAKILAANPQISNSNTLTVGQASHGDGI